jgi:Fe-S oxidoreductase
MRELAEKGHQPEYLLWIGCAGAFDLRYRKVARAFASVLLHAGVDFACLGSEETCTGDPARRAGNEMLFQMQALQVIDTFGRYQVRKIITICPHCFNTFHNEYPDLGGRYEVVHHSVFLNRLINEGRLKFPGDGASSDRVTFHDPCYLGRGNNIYDAPRDVLKAAGCNMKEMPRSRSFALCCGAGGAQMFKEAEPGTHEVYTERTREALATGAGTIVTACPFCMTMLTDGIKKEEKEDAVSNLDIAEIVAARLGLEW